VFDCIGRVGQNPYPCRVDSQQIPKNPRRTGGRLFGSVATGVRELLRSRFASVGPPAGGVHNSRRVVSLR
jgi:hypothetical protein